MEPRTGREQDPSDEQGKADNRENEVHVYSHSGIRERQGTIPMWLLLVVIGLLIWAVYYTIRYWSPG